MRRLLLPLALLALAACRADAPPPGPAPPAPARDASPPLRLDARLDTAFAGTEGTFVVLDPARADTLRTDPALARTRFLPASTYKIPHTLLALASGVAPDTHLTVAYDPARDPAAAWWPDTWTQEQTLGSAFRRSAVWVYRELARRIGPGRAQAWLDTLGYGNRRIGNQPDAYWLDASLRIAPDEQVAFLDRLWAGRLPAAPAHVAAVRAFMRLGEGPGWTLYGKTGTGTQDGRPVGWLVGVAERDGAAYPYALLQIGPPGGEAWPRERRRATTEALLRGAGVLPPAR